MTIWKPNSVMRWASRLQRPSDVMQSLRIKDLSPQRGSIKTSPQLHAARTFFSKASRRWGVVFLALHPGG